MVHPPGRRPTIRAGRISRLVTLAFLALVLSACEYSSITIDSPLTIFEPAGPFAEEIDGLFWPVFWTATVIFVLVQAALIFILFKFRDRGQETEPKQVEGNAKLEVTWTVIPALILAAIAVPTVKSVFNLTSCGDDAMEVRVIGHQWWFEYQYPDYGVETANVLVMPVGQEICATMTSDDVIHNLWFPAMNGKRYLIPGQVTTLRLQADVEGEYWGHCGEFCGLSHSLMRTRAEVVSQSEFDAWITAQLAPAEIPTDGPAAQGWALFDEKGCSACHTVRTAEGTSGPADGDFQGPDLTHFSSRDVFAGAYLPWDTADGVEGISYDEALAMWLANPPGVKPGSFMPNLDLTNDEINALIAWLETLK